MAEAFLNSRYGDRYKAHSAETGPKSIYCVDLAEMFSEYFMNFFWLFQYENIVHAG